MCPQPAPTRARHDKAAVQREGADESACKPDPVPGRLTALRSATIHLGLPSPTGSCGLPAGSDGPPSNACAAPRGASWSCSGWGLPSRPGHPGRWWSLTPPFHPYPPLAAGGGLFSVALSRGSPRVAVDNHPALRSPDFPRRRARPPTRPPGLLVRPARLARPPRVAPGARRGSMSRRSGDFAHSARQGPRRP